MKEKTLENPIDQRLQNRLILVFIFLVLLFIVVLVRLFYIQVINSEKYKKLAENQHIKRIELKAKRGNIYDRNGNLLATTVTSRSFAIDPILLKKYPQSVYEYFSFGKTLGLPKEKLESILNTNRRFVWLARGLTEYPPQLDTFSFSGLIKLSEPKRVYMFGKTISNLLGITNLDNSGISGIEYSFDTILKGKDGFVYYLKDAQGHLHPSLDLPSNPPINGKDIKLTIDIRLQNIANYYLQEGIKKTNAKGGCIIFMEPNTGEILALANSPNFEPNELKQIDNNNLGLYAVNFAFEPGSTIKPFIASIAYERGFINDNSFFNGYNGKFVYGDITIIDEHPFNKLGLDEALIYSSNIAFAQISSSIPPEILENDLLKLGFGKKTEIGLPGELRGYVKFSDTLSLAQRMFLGFGYGLLTTPLQIITAYSSLANGGCLVKPQIILDQPKTHCDTIFKRTTVEKLKSILKRVVTQGTAIETKIDGIEIGGKTGTSQKYEFGSYSKTKYVNSFVGFLPANKPKILILILLDEPKSSTFASSTVVPIFRKIVLSILNSKLSYYIY